jgi:hypothetical protein
MNETELHMTTCCDGTGYADYAAVPCPKPHCPAAEELIKQMEPEPPHGKRPQLQQPQ